MRVFLEGCVNPVAADERVSEAHPKLQALSAFSKHEVYALKV
jgi:hypothetical protein